MDKKYGLNTILFGVVITLLVLILVKNSPNYVVAQGDGGFAKHVFGVVGFPDANRQPFYLVDTRQEVIMVYEYGVQGDGLGLVSTRSYRYDKLLEQYGRSNFGPKVDQIKKELEKVRK
jgi:hypothetical protein